jgi:riboflavin kinase / FMN adenylyltransferase
LRAGGFPTLRLPVEEDTKLIPPDGIYAIHLISGNTYYRGMLKIRRPGGDESISPLETRLELHLFEYSNNLVGKTGTVYFHKQMRDSGIFTKWIRFVDRITGGKGRNRRAYLLTTICHGTGSS